VRRGLLNRREREILPEIIGRIGIFISVSLTYVLLDSLAML
jgi:hypothetical protein